MKTSTITKALGLLALLGSSASMAATITISASTLTPNVGDSFTLTLAGDIPNTFTGTIAMAFDASKVAYVSGAVLAPYTVFTKNSPTTANPTVFDVERPTSSGPNPGVYNIAVLTFQALAAGAAGIVLNDDGGNVSGWFDDGPNADYIPVSYTQANVIIQGAPVVPVPAAAWLFISALGGLATLKRRAV
ncbi:MAG: VPLPA-CTERM sorting domain-containing protein [Chromatiales bacterium]|nr:VPLPA-CTERM sorting domain-containing protein [Chromatiales bacterium]